MSYTCACARGHPRRAISERANMEKSGESVRAPFSRKRVNNRDANMRSALRDSMGHGNWDDEPRATGIMERDATAARSRAQRDSDLWRIL